MSIGRLLVVPLLASVLLPDATKPPSACSCDLFSLQQRAAQAQAVFTGTVTGITKGLADRTVNFDVDTVYKGETDPSIDVHTPYGGGDCGIGFIVDRRYTVFAFRAQGVLNTYSCAPPVSGDVDPSVLGLGSGTTGLHRPLPSWLVVFTVVAAVAVLLAILLVARRRAEWRLPGDDQPK